MKAKEYIIQKLVDLGKKHKWMKYPMLAVVSLISLFFLVLEKCMERPKRAVIALVCMVLIISQSWYLISIAGGDSTDEGQPETGISSGMNDIMAVDVDDPADGSSDTGDDTATTENTGTGSDFGNAKVTCMILNKTNYGINSDFSIDLSSLASGPYKLPVVPGLDENIWEFVGYKINGTDQTITDLTMDILQQYGSLSSSSGNYTFYLNMECERIAYKLTYEYNAQQYCDYAYRKDGYLIHLSKDDKMFTRAGYTCGGWLINGVRYYFDDYEEKDMVTTLSGDTIATPIWRGNPYKVEFLPGCENATGEMEKQTLYYDDEATLNRCQFKRVGYSFAGWQIDSNGDGVGEGGIFIDGRSVLNLTNVKDATVTMIATWVYSPATFHPSDVFEFEYTDIVTNSGSGKNGTIEVDHANGSGGNFDITFIDAWGTTADGEVTKENFKSITGLDVRVSVLQHGNVIELLTSSSDGIRTIGTVWISFEIQDNNNPEQPIVRQQVEVHLLPKQLEIIGVSNAAKVYDGSDWIEVGGIQFDGAKPGADLVVHSEEQSGYFNDPNVGTNKDITVRLSLYGEDAKYYRIGDYGSKVTEVTIPGIGTITKRPIGVTTAPVYPEGRDYFLTGEEPEYTSDIHVEDLPADLAATDERLILNAIAGKYTCDYKPNYPAGEFAIDIDTNRVNLQNYMLVVTQGTLTVKQEAPVELLDYVISGSRQPGNQWFYGENPRAAATGTNGYDMVYLTNDFSAKAVTYDSARFRKELYITEAMCSQNATLYIQLANSRTHAVTSMEPIEVYVDITAPVIDTANIEISTVNTGTFGKIGNFLSFGNFFKESLMITIPVSDELSGAKSLTYYLDGSIWEDGIEIPVRNGKATFQVPLKYKGTIALTASDNAGNSSVLADLIGIENSNYWVIENEAPAIRASAVDLEGNTAYSGEGLYYKTVKMTASVTDQDAGVAYVIWNITKDGQTVAEEDKQLVSDTGRLLTSYDFERIFDESGAYTVTATAYDNAENVSLPTEVFRFSIDGTGPDIQVSPADYDESWGTEKTITFTVTDTESGVDMLSLLDENNRPYPYTTVLGNVNTYTFTVTGKGTYTIKASDRAGNVTEVPLEFTRVSSEVPDTPTVVTTPMEPEHVEQGWFISNPEIRILEPETTPDGTAITTYYRLWLEGTEEPATSQIADGSFQLPSEGAWNIRAWAETESGMRSASDGLCQVRYDGTAPVISDIIINGKGTSNRVSFRVTEGASGLAELKAVYNNDTSNSHDITFRYVGNGEYAAEFTAAMKGSYSIRATDGAGNTAKAEAFEPITIVVTKITGSLEEGIVVTGRVESGTFAIDSVAVKYGLAEQEPSMNADSLIVTTDENGDKAFTAKFTQLSDDSRYRFLITAMTTNGESSHYTGAFKTGIREITGINVAGTVYDETLNSDSEETISVILYHGNDIVQFQNVKNNEAFIFRNVPDGAYVVRAVHGNRSAGKGLVIHNNAIVEPTDPIHLVLYAGQSTSIEYGGEETPKVSVSGLENIFDDTTNFGSDQDFAIINAGGVVEFCMEINGLSESQVPPSDIELIRRNLRNNERVANYMDFSIWKRNVGAYGVISQMQVSSISGGKTVRISIPLSDELLARESISVLRVHNGVVERLSDLDNDPYTYTIESALFSTYALVYADSSIDNSGSSSGGNGNGNGVNGGNGNGTGSTTDISRRPNSNGLVSSSGTSSPRTGDTVPVVWIGMLGVLAATAGVFALKMKKSQKKHHNLP